MSDAFFTLPRWLWGAEIHFDQMMYDWLYSSHGCLFWRCLHWGIAISGSFIIGWPLYRGILFSVDDGFLSHVPSLEDIRCPFSHWSMRQDWRVSSGVLYTGAYPFRSMMVFRHSCSLEAIRFISHWSTGCGRLISLIWSQEHSLLIIVDIFLRWLDQDADTDTYESL